MDKLNRITEIVNEVIEENNKNLKELKSLSKLFFKNKNQDYVDNLDQNKLKPFIKSYDLILKKGRFTFRNRFY
ncbi:hypothetical protein J4440_05280 [Candidatus Woesearchaeota archaeon]|nr:hypothetical protein [Candidatus Woesearchaeota archaeon]